MSKYNFIIVIYLLISSISFAAKKCNSLSDFDVITKTITKNFYDKTFKSLDWASRIQFYRKQITCNSNEKTISIVVNKLLGELKTSHTGIYTQADLKYWALKSIFSGDLNKFKVPFFGVWPTKIQDKIFAKFILEGSSAEKNGLKRGDLMISTDKTPFNPIGISMGNPSNIKFSPRPNNILEVVLRPQVLSMQTYFVNATKQSEKIIFINNKKIGYFHLWCGTHQSFLKSMNHSLTSFKKKHIEGLVIDLRDGFGGADPSYLSMITQDIFFKRLPRE